MSLLCSQKEIIMRSLELVGEEVDEARLKEILQRIDADGGISTLRLADTSLSPSLAVLLADFLEKNKSLTRVDLSGNNRMGVHGVRCLVESLTKNSTVQSLTLARCKLSSESLEPWTQFFRDNRNHTLKEIDLSRNQFQDNAADSIALIIQETTTHGISFDFSFNELSDVTTKQVADALSSPHPYIVGIRLDSNQDEDEGTIYRERIKYYLRRNQSALNRVKLLDRFDLIAKSSVSVAICHIDNDILSLGDADRLSAALRGNISIIELRLQNNALPQEATRRIVLALRDSPSITSFAIVDNNIGDVGFRAINQLLRSQPLALRSLKVSNSIHLNTQTGLQELSHRTAASLHYAFANFSLLSDVSLSNCALDDTRVGAIVSGMSWGARVESLSLVNNAITDRVVHVFVRLLHRCQRLYRLDLSGNRFTLRGLSPLALAASSHRQLRLLALGRFPHDADGLIPRELAPVLRRSASLERVELSTAAARSRSAEALARLNAALSAAHAGPAALERQARELSARRQAQRVRWRAMARWVAAGFVFNLGPLQAHGLPAEGHDAVARRSPERRDG